MPNVDLCSRLAELAMSAKKDEIKDFANEIITIPNENRVKIFRSKNEQEIEQILEKFWNKIRIVITNKYFKNLEFQKLKLQKSSNDNKVGADLFCILPNKQKLDIELKFGLETARNIGMTTFNKIFDTDIFTKTLAVSFRKEWQKKFIKEQNENKQFLRLWSSINNAIDEFNSFYKKLNFKLSDKSAKYMEKTILLSTGNGKSNNKLIKFIPQKDDFNILEYGQIGLGEWIVDEVIKIGARLVSLNFFCVFPKVF